MVILFFTLGSVGAQSVSADDLNGSKILKSSSLTSNSTKATASSITNKVKSNVTTKAVTNVTKKTTNATKASSNKTTINKKTLAKTSTNFVNYVEKNGKFPKVKISNKNYSNTEYLYLLTKAVENGSNSKIDIKKNLVKKYNNTNIKSAKGTLNKTEYVKMAGKTRKFIEKNKRAPNWVSSSKGNVPYNQLILTYSKCLDFFNKNNRLPNTVKLDDLDLDKIKSKINKNKAKSSSNSVKTTNTTKKTNSSSTTKKTTANTKTTKTTSKETANSSAKTSSNKKADGNAGLVEITMNHIHSLLNNILDKLDPSKYKIDVTKTDEANVKLNTSKINVDVKGKSSINVKVSANNAKANATKKTTASTKTTKANTTKSTSGKTTKTVSKTVSKTASKTSSNSLKLNDTYIKESLKKYLSSSKNCQIGNKEIKALAKKLTSTLKSDYDKGKKLFNWVRDNIQYKKYRNTRRGAAKTLQTKKGNCVDQSHLLVALSRAAGIPARYVKGDKCRFTTGYVSGHIWTQILVGKKWVVADPTSSRNSFGNIKNWNTKNYVLCGKYSSISF